MTPKQIIALAPAERLDLETRALSGGGADMRDFVLFAAWRRLLENKALKAKERIAAFVALCRIVSVKVEGA